MPAEHLTRWLLWITGAYLAGSIPFALLLGRAYGIDVRQQGSGNVGATNLGRALGKRWGVICFLLDAGKGLAPVLGYSLYANLYAAGDNGAVGGAVATIASLVVALAAILGHVYPLWLRFKGGKGVATGFGAMLGCWPVLTIAGLASLGSWVIVVLISGYVGLGSVVAALLLPLATLLAALWLDASMSQLAIYVVATTLLSLMVVVRHRANIARLRAGTESKVTWSLSYRK